MEEFKNEQLSSVNQQRCLVYEFSYDELNLPHIRLIQQCGIWKSDHMTSRIEKTQIVAMDDYTQQTWITPFDEAKIVGISNSITFHLPTSQNPAWVKWSTHRIPSKKFLIVISREFQGKVYIDDYEMIRTDENAQIISKNHAL